MQTTQTRLQNNIDRMRDMADAMFKAFEATPLPSDYPGLARAARTLGALNRLIRQVYAEKIAKPAKEAKPQTTVQTERKPVNEPAKKASVSLPGLGGDRPDKKHRALTALDQVMGQVFTAPELPAFARRSA